MIKALSIKQPWAWLIVQGFKPVENRTWWTNYQGPVLIHAGKRPDPQATRISQLVREQFGIDIPEKLDLGGIVGRQRLTDSLGEIPAPAGTPVVAAAAEPEKLPLAVRYLAEELQQLGQSVWQAFWAKRHQGEANAPVVISRECVLPLATLLQWFVVRQEIGASQMPMQFGDSSELHVPEHQLWIEGADGTGPMAGISFEGDTLRFGRGPGYSAMGGGYLLEPRPETQAYYRIEVAGEDANKILRQQVVIQGQGRRLVLTGSGRLGIRKDLVKKLQRLIETLPAMPKSETDVSPAEEQDDFEDFEADALLYSQHYCTRCQRPVSDLETMATNWGDLIHTPAKGECNSTIRRLRPGEAAPKSFTRAAH